MSMYKQLENAEVEGYVFKHSSTCGISVTAKEHVDKFAETHDVYLIIVQEQRDISNQIAENYAVKHESPQFLQIKEGKVVCVLNHDEINTTNIQQGIRED